MSHGQARRWWRVGGTGLYHRVRGLTTVCGIPLLGQSLNAGSESRQQQLKCTCPECLLTVRVESTMKILEGASHAH